MDFVEILSLFCRKFSASPPLPPKDPDDIYLLQCDGVGPIIIQDSASMQTAKVMAEIGDRPEATGGDSPAISALKWNGASNGSFISMSCDGREALMLSRFFSYGSATEDDFEALLSELLGETLELRSALRCGNSAVGKME